MVGVIAHQAEQGPGTELVRVTGLGNMFLFQLRKPESTYSCVVPFLSMRLGKSMLVLSAHFVFDIEWVVMYAFKMPIGWGRGGGYREDHLPKILFFLQERTTSDGLPQVCLYSMSLTGTLVGSVALFVFIGLTRT